MRRIVVLVAALSGVVGACSSFSSANEVADGGADGAPSGNDDAGVADAADAADAAHAASAYEALILAALPMAYWRMGALDGLIIPDESGNNNNLVLQGSGYLTGQPGALTDDPDTAIHFDGTKGSAIAAMPRAFDYPAPQSFTIELWAKMDPLEAGDTVPIFLTHTESLADGGLIGFTMFFATQGTPPFTGFVMQASSGKQQDVQGAAPVPGEWDYFVAVLDGTAGTGKMTMYVNGTQSTMTLTPGAAGTTTAQLVIAPSFPGALDEIAFYNRALPIQEIASHYAVGHHP